MNTKDISDESVKALLKTLGAEAKKRKLTDVEIPKLPKPRGPDKRTLPRTKAELKAIFDPLLVKFKEYKALLKTKATITETITITYDIEICYSTYYDSPKCFFVDEDWQRSKPTPKNETNKAYTKVKTALDEARKLKKEIKKDFSTTCKTLKVYQDVVIAQYANDCKSSSIKAGLLEIL